MLASHSIDLRNEKCYAGSQICLGSPTVGLAVNYSPPLGFCGCGALPLGRTQYSLDGLLPGTWLGVFRNSKIHLSIKFLKLLLFRPASPLNTAVHKYSDPFRINTKPTGSFVQSHPLSRHTTLPHFCCYCSISRVDSFSLLLQSLEFWFVVSRTEGLNQQ